MNKRIKALWVKALRSRKYEQCTGQLRNENNQFCCLGVLCNLHAIEHPKIAKKETDPGMYLGECGALPIEVIAWAGINASQRIQGHSLMTWNDMKKASFAKIADLIEGSLSL